MELTIVVPFHNGHAYIDALLDSLPSDLPVWIIDDQSRQPLEVNRPNVTIYRLMQRQYFTGAVNWALERIRGDVLILNQDVVLQGTQWLDLIADKRDHYALIGERIAGPHPAWPNGYIHGTFMFIREDVPRRIGLMDAKHFPLWGSTCDYQVRACRAWFAALPTDIPGMIHRRMGTFGTAIAELLREQPDKQDLFIRTPPLISVIISNYNYASYLPDALASLIGGDSCLGHLPGQTFQGFEVIIVDDASTDDSWEVIRSMVNPWQGIHGYRLTENCGTPAALNAGIRRAHGRYIAILCADDMMAPERLERMLEVQEAHPHSIVYDDMRILNNGKLTQAWIMPDYDFERLLYKNGIHAGIMFPKAAWEDVGGYPEIMRWGREDWAMNIALGRLGWCGKHLCYPGYYYRREGQNRSLTNSDREHAQLFRQQLQELFPDVYGGDYPMTCCGKRGSARSAGQRPMAARAASEPIGARGMVQIEYIGGNEGLMDWVGQQTGIIYRFGGARPVGFVDARDAPWFLGLHINHRPQFRRYRPPEPPPASVEVIAAVVPEQTEVETVPQDELPRRRRGRPRKEDSDA